MTTLRNIGHYIIGLMCAYLIGSVTEVSEYLGVWNKFLIIVVFAIIGAGVGFFYEVLQEYYTVAKIDLKDVKRTAIGGAFGGLLVIIYDNDVLFYTFLSLVTIVGCLEFYFNFYKHKDKFKHFTDENENS